MSNFWDNNYGSSNSYGIGDYSGDSREAEKTYRDLYEAQWEDYKKRFLPYQEKLLDSVTSTEMLDEQLGRISATAKQSTDLSAQSANMARDRYGIQQSGQQQQQFDANLESNQALSMANAQNQARSAAYDRYQGAMTGSGIRDTTEGGATGGATS